MKALLILILLMMCSCAVSGQIRDDGVIILRGWGASAITFPDGTKLEKVEPISTPDFTPQK